MDWDTALREDRREVNPLGLYDLERKIRPVGEAYKQLIADWREVLPTQSHALTLPLDLPGEGPAGRPAELLREHAFWSHLELRIERRSQRLAGRDERS